MSTFVVRFVGEPIDRFRGSVRHVGSGEETRFYSVSELLAFFETLTATGSSFAESPVGGRGDTVDTGPDDETG